MLAGRLSQTNDRLRLLEIRDSLLARYPANERRGLTVAIDSSIPAGLAASLQRLVRDKWDRLGIRSTMPVLVAVVLDSATTSHGFQRRYAGPLTSPINVFLPRTSAARCIAVLRMSNAFNRLPSQVRASVAQNLKAPSTIDAVLGPCAYLASFGRPGAHVGAWLRAHGWSLARMAAWNTSSPPWAETGDPRAYWFRDRLATLGDPSWRVRVIVGHSGLACIAGEAGACVDAAGADRHAAPQDSAWSNSVVNTFGASAYYYYFAIKPSPLGAADSWLVSDMARSLGDSAFRQFWTSDKPVPEAFAAASGVSLDAWVRAWARRTYGNVPTGPSLPENAALAGLVALIAGFAMAVVIERRRRVA